MNSLGDHFAGLTATLQSLPQRREERECSQFSDSIVPARLISGRRIMMM